MGNKTKKILVSILLIVLIAATVGYYLFNKGPMDVKHSSAIKITATDLYEQFSKDSVTALKKYSGKVLEVSGELNGISSNQTNEKILLLKTNTDAAFINCTMEEDPGDLKANDKISIKGICSGIGQGDEDLGIKGDLYLTRCFLIK